MSRIYFHSPSGDAEIQGSERAHMHCLCGDLLIASIGSFSDYEGGRHWLRKLLPGDHWINTETEEFERSIKLYLRSQSERLDEGLVYHGERIQMFQLALNTAAFVGSDAVKLMARLHGQCEIHCYIAGANRNWLADIIEEGRKFNVMRADQGWENLVEFLRLRNNEPVVCSYSVCDQFPTFALVPNDHLWRKSKDDPETGGASDFFWNADASERWEVCWQNLYETRPDLELTPDNWRDYYFGHGISGFDLKELAESRYGETALVNLYSGRNTPAICKRGGDKET